MRFPFLRHQPHVFRKYKADLMTDFSTGASKVLEIGSGHRHYASFCRGDYVCVDVAWSPDVVASAEFLPFRTGCFDRVVMMDVIEHVEEVSSALKECHRILSEDGMLLIVTPNRNGFGLYDSYADPTHKHHFTWRTIETALRNIGFELKEKIPLHLHIYFPIKSEKLRGFQQSICVVAVKKKCTISI
ncbi:MAG: class I SAM-dependent methyltransferase [Candidatus Caldarchaeum sp.]|nr:class I SAM-dependent methyltransferase [Candidatus Caldarchaeum sp.]